MSSLAVVLIHRALIDGDGDGDGIVVGWEGLIEVEAMLVSSSGQKSPSLAVVGGVRS